MNLRVESETKKDGWIDENDYYFVYRKKKAIKEPNSKETRKI